MKSQFLMLYDFLKSPEIFPKNESLATKNKILYAAIIFPAAGALICSLLWKFILFLRDLGWFRLVEEDYNSHRGILFNLIITIIITPLLEELIFRFPLKYFVANKHFKPIFYLTTLVFGLVHFVNYETNTSAYFYVLLIVLPQLFIGFILGYIRLSFGFKYSILCHAVYNLIGFSILYFI